MACATRGTGIFCVLCYFVVGYALLDVSPYLFQISAEACLVPLVDDVEQFAQFVAYQRDLSARQGVEQDFAQQTVVLG